MKRTEHPMPVGYGAHSLLIINKSTALFRETQLDRISLPYEFWMRNSVLPYLRYRNGCVLLGKYVAYTGFYGFS